MTYFQTERKWRIINLLLKIKTNEKQKGSLNNNDNPFIIELRKLDTHNINNLNRDNIIHQEHIKKIVIKVIQI